MASLTYHCLQFYFYTITGEGCFKLVLSEEDIEEETKFCVLYVQVCVCVVSTLSE